MDNWQEREFEKEEEALKELAENDHALFIFRTFWETTDGPMEPTGNIEFYQSENGEWNDILAFNGWRVVGLNMRGHRFNFKDPKNEIKWASGKDVNWTDDYTENLEELFGVKTSEKCVARVASESAKAESLFDSAILSLSRLTKEHTYIAPAPSLVRNLYLNRHLHLDLLDEDHRQHHNEITVDTFPHPSVGRVASVVSVARLCGGTSHDYSISCFSFGRAGP